VLAHLKTLETRGAPADRQVWKVRLVRGLYQRGMAMEDVRQLLRFIDWIMDLPRPLQERFEEEVAHYEEEINMPFMTGFERRGLEKGLLRGIEVALELKLGAEGLKLLPEIRELQDHELLETVLESIPKAANPDAVRRVWTRKRRSKKARQKE
jgi:hypothetical protein